MFKIRDTVKRMYDLKWNNLRDFGLCCFEFRDTVERT